MQCQTFLSLKKCLRAVYFYILHSMQYAMVLGTNTNTLHVQIMCKNCTVVPPTCFGGEDAGQTPYMRKEGFYNSYMYLFEMWCWRRMEKISWTDHVRNEEVLLKSQ